LTDYQLQIKNDVDIIEGVKKELQAEKDQRDNVIRECEEKVEEAKMELVSMQVCVS
jgi:hypothetical protein